MIEPAPAPVIQVFCFRRAVRRGCHQLHGDGGEATAVCSGDEAVADASTMEVYSEENAAYTLRAGNAAASVEETLSVEAGIAGLPTTPPTRLPDEGPTPIGQAIIIDHACTDLSSIPNHWLEEAKRLTVC